jgi:multisubunit Na+/H+ antiporter MnhB subunit
MMEANWKRHIGSTVALVLGGLSILGGLGSGHFGGAIGGVVMILGALAYRSAKKRKLGEVKSTALRRLGEVGLLVLLSIVILAQNDLKTLIATDPVPNFVVPVWAIIAYLIIAIMPQRWLVRKTSAAS